MLHPCENASQYSDGRGDAAQQPQELATLVQVGNTYLPRDVRKFRPPTYLVVYGGGASGGKLCLDTTRGPSSGWTITHILDPVSLSTWPL